MNIRLNDRTYLIKQSGKYNIYKRSENGALIYEELNETAYEILELAENKNIQEICNTLSIKYDEKLNDVEEIVYDFLNNCKHKGYIEIDNEKRKTNSKIFGDINMIIPHHMLIETTYSCPLECKHCINESGSHRTESIPSDTLIKTLNKLSELGTKEITLTGGEVTTRNDFIDLVKLCSSKFDIVSILTTGHLLTENLILEIDNTCEKNIIWQISIDGVEETHNSIRCNKEAYKRAINAITMLKKHGYFVSISSTIHKDNIEQMEAIYNNIKDTGSDRLSYGMIIEKGRADKNNVSVNVDFLKRLELIRKKYANEDLLVDQDSFNYDTEIVKKKCDIGTYLLSIQATGDVIICPGFDIPMGNINDNPIQEILLSKKARSLLELTAPSQDLCGECPSLVECKGCHATPFNKEYQSCTWKNVNEKIISPFLELEKVN